MNNTLTNLTDIAGRGLLGFVFLGAGLNKIGAYAGTQGYMESVGVAGELLPLVIALEVLAGLAIMLGFGARLSALALAGFSIAAAVLFHGGADQMQSILFMKNVAIAGGLLMVAASGPRDWSVEALLRRRGGNNSTVTVAAH